MKRRATPELVAGLCRASRDTSRDPYSDAGWPQHLRPDSAWCTSPDRVSLYGTPHWEALDGPARRTLAFWEAVAFFSLNVHGESVLIEGLARRLGAARLDEAADYLPHFLAEEVGHSHLFVRFCERYGGGVFRDLAVPGGEPEPPDPTESDLRFFARVLAFEELVMQFNRRMARDAALHPVPRQINAMHLTEEQRHLAFGRRIVETLRLRWCDAAPPERVAALRDHLAAFIHATWRSFYSVDAYRAAGLPQPHEIREAAWAHPCQRARRREIGAAALGFLVQLGLLNPEAVA